MNYIVDTYNITITPKSLNIHDMKSDKYYEYIYNTQRFSDEQLILKENIYEYIHDNLIKKNIYIESFEIIKDNNYLSLIIEDKLNYLEINIFEAKKIEKNN